MNDILTALSTYSNIVGYVHGLALVSISQTDVTSFSQLSIKYKNFQNEPNPDPNPEPNPKPNPEPNPNQIEGKNHL